MNDSKESYKFDLGVEGLSSCTPLIMSHRPYYLICFFLFAVSTILTSIYEAMFYFRRNTENCAQGWKTLQTH